MQSALLLNIVITQCSTIFQLFSSEDKSLLIWRNTFLILDLLFDVIDGVGRFDIQSDRLSSEGFYKDLHFEEAAY